MRILVSAYACHPSPDPEAFPGEAILGWNLVRELARTHRLDVLTRTYNRPAIEAARAADPSFTARFHYIDYSKRLRRMTKDGYLGIRIYYWLWQRKAYRAAKALARTEAFDAAHQITFSNDWMPSYIGARLGLPFIWGPIGGGQKVPGPLMEVLSPLERRKERTRWRLQGVWRATPARRRCGRNARAILVCNGETKALLGRWESKIRDFSVNGIAPADLAPASGGRPRGERFDVLYAGRLDAIKGLPLALRAFRLFSEARPEARFEIVGEGPEDGALKSLAAELRLGERVAFTPWLSRTDLLARMGRSDVFLFPSLRDGGGAVVIEAMAAGVPVLCLDVGGPGFHVRPEWGIKVAPGDPETVVEGLAAALEDLAADDARRRAMGEAARRRAEEFYLWSRLGEQVETIYREVLGGRR